MSSENNKYWVNVDIKIKTNNKISKKINEDYVIEANSQEAAENKALWNAVDAHIHEEDAEVIVRKSKFLAESTR